MAPQAPTQDTSCLLPTHYVYYQVCWGVLKDILSQMTRIPIKDAANRAQATAAQIGVSGKIAKWCWDFSLNVF